MRVRILSRALAGLVFLLAVAAAEGEAIAQIVTENAGAISPVTPILRESVSYLDAENLDELRWGNQLIVSIDTTRELKLNVPVVWREARFRDAQGAEQREDLFGLGDVSLRFKQSLWQVDEVMESTRWAALAELTAPTGEDNEEEGGVRIPRRLQLGTGDWTLGGGTAFTVIRDRHRFSAEGFFRHRTRHEGVRLSQTVDLNVAYWYRLVPARFSPEGGALEVRGVLEILSTYRFPSEFGSRRAKDDGFLVWFAPGLQVYPTRWLLFEGNVQVPVLQDVEDNLGDRHFGASLVVKFLF